MTKATSPFPPQRKYRTAESAMSDRRRAARVPHRASFDIRPLLNDGMGSPITVILLDLSVSGMGVLHSSALPMGHQYQIPLQRGFTESLSLVCTVVRCEQLDEGLYSIGFEFNSSPAAVDAGSRQLTGQPPRPE
jgi:c-di-GMP-binding flagellar brake protein YcgR